MNRKHQHKVRTRTLSYQDEQLLQRHLQLAPQLHASHTLRRQCQERLELMHQAGLIKHGAYLFWDTLLSMPLSLERFTEEIANPSPQAYKYRRKSPCLWLISLSTQQASTSAHHPIELASTKKTVDK